ncbi:hypothetical protein J5N97_018378 [Dioscorea zingiberensis]|uniref:Uncharacterized protein n=1 Tax=Dioscorea zingiberensis TaxID=325984 RepID=A0A9D5HHB2_9LILI|nr:hypothetical protein J5N97_018378 [Dioscorea zingiberensis]
MGCKLSTSNSMVRTSEAVRDTASELFCINRNAVDSFIQLKGDIDGELLKLVEDELKITMKTLHRMDNFKCFRIKVRDLVHPFLAAEESSRPLVIIQKVKDFKATGEPDAMSLTLEDYKQDFSRQLLVSSKLRLRKKRLDDMLREVKAWRKAWDIVYSIVKFAVIVLSVVLPVLTAPPAAAAAATGASGVMGLVQPWVDSKWDDYQSSLEAERKLTGKILNKASLTSHGLNYVENLLRPLVAQIATLTDHAEFGIEEDEDAAARMVVERMKRKAAEVMASVESLDEKADRRREELRRTAVTFLQCVTDQVGGFCNGEINIPVGYDN